VPAAGGGPRRRGPEPSAATGPGHRRLPRLPAAGTGPQLRDQVTAAGQAAAGARGPRPPDRRGPYRPEPWALTRPPRPAPAPGPGAGALGFSFVAQSIELRRSRADPSASAVQQHWRISAPAPGLDAGG